ncbi:MAG: hypothetical protein BWK79_12615 [Beggiatoa sp. IS2]|nr:MAG: hypothetical protein BWK79_12615 [Beggiatoa sp. IS2]
MQRTTPLRLVNGMIITHLLFANVTFATETVDTKGEEIKTKAESTPSSEPAKIDALEIGDIAEKISVLDQGEQNKKMMDLMTQKHHPCLGCHQLEAKTIGPSFKEVAAKYKEEKDREPLVKTLSEKIKEGGSGNWGKVMMPENPSITQEDLTMIVNWILLLPTDN